MKWTTLFSFIFPCVSLVNTSLAATNTSLPRFGNFYNFWTVDDNNVFDLTRGITSGSKTIATSSKGNSSISIPINSSALVIIDMQNFFIHPNLSSSPAGRDAVPPTLQMIDAFRNLSMPVLWVQWGLTQFDLLNMPPSFLYGFSDNGDPTTSFGSEMGMLGDIDMGPKLMRGSWNAEAWGPLFTSQQAGIANGTDFFFNKNRLSGLWGAQTPLGQFLQDRSLTTLFFGGVNIDQCVWGTLLDAYYKGYDTILVDDISATVSPEFATQMVNYNGGLDGWVTNSTMVLAGLA